MTIPSRASGFALPPRSSGDVLPVASLGSEMLQTGVSYWRQLAAGRRFPPRASLVSCLSSRLRDHAVLIEVLEGGADYEYRQVGAALMQAFDGDFTGRRISALVAGAPRVGLGLRMVYDMVRASGEPLAYRGWIGADLEAASFFHHESAILPLGQEGAVDHLLQITALVMRARESA